VNLLASQRDRNSSLRRNDIQVLRGVSILAVLLFHAWPNVYTQGYLGVDVFFVISGAVMTPRIVKIFDSNNALPTSKKLLQFYRARFFRLAPAFSTSLIFSTIIVFLFGNLGDHPRFSMQGIYSMLFVGNIGAARWSGTYFSPDQNPLVHLWSLSVEEQFYFAIPIAFFLFVVLLKYSGFTIRSIFKIYTTFMSLLILGSLLLFLNPAINLFLSNQKIFGFNFAFSNSFAFYAPWQRIWEFALGSIAFNLWRNAHTVFNKFSLPCVALLISITIFPLKALDQKIATLIVCLLTAMTIFLGFNTNRNLQIVKLLEKLGDYSYSIYLIHLPLVYIFSKGFLSRIGISMSLGITISLFLSVFFGSINYSKIERPLRDNQISKIGIVFKNRGLVTFGLVLTTAACLITMNLGSNSHYWGLDRNIRLPTPPGYIGRNECAMDTTIGEPCLFKKKSSRGLVLLIGDSHAAELSKVVKEVSFENGFNVAIGTHSGFPIAIPSRGTLKKQNTSLSYSNTQASLDYINKHHPYLVIVSMNFAQVEKSETERAIFKIRSIVPHVLVINQTPIFTDSEYMKFLSWFDNPYSPPRSVKLDKIDMGSIVANSYIANWGRKNQIPILNTWSLFCDSNQCTRYENNEWLYSDLQHLTIYGADKLKPILNKQLSVLAKKD
jgi:peptidoglycan/LPS O-acetylase OafA/YrhL